MSEPTTVHPPAAPPSMEDILNNLQHPKIVEAFLLAPAFTNKLPQGITLSLRSNQPVIGRPGIDPAALEGEKYTWAIMSKRNGVPGSDEIASAAMVDTTLTDDDMDAFDAATEAGNFVSYVKDNAMHYRANGVEVGPNDKHYQMYNFALEGGALAHAGGGSLILSNGPRWLVVSADKGLVFSRTYGQREDRSPVAEDRPTTSMYGGLVGNAFELVITEEELKRLNAAKKEAADKAALEAPKEEAK